MNALAPTSTFASEGILTVPRDAWRSLVTAVNQLLPVCQHPHIARTHVGAGLHAVVCNDCLHAWWQFGVSSLETAPSCVASGLES